MISAVTLLLKKLLIVMEDAVNQVLIVGILLHVEDDKVGHHDSLVLGVIGHPHWLDFDGKLDLKYCVKLRAVLEI